MPPSEATLLAHCGARTVTREELDRIDAPPPTRTWYPVRHASVIESVSEALRDAGFESWRLRYAVSRHDARMFATMDLKTALDDGVSLAVGIRNSTDRSLPLGFCAGSRVFVCDNLAFRSELLVHRKHTRFGRERFIEDIRAAVRTLDQFRLAESARIARMKRTLIADIIAESLILRAIVAGITPPHLAAAVVREWREPEHEAFRPRNVWSLLNAFTAVLDPTGRGNPVRHASQTIRLSALLDAAASERAREDEPTDDVEWVEPVSTVLVSAA